MSTEPPSPRLLFQLPTSYPPQHENAEASSSTASPSAPPRIVPPFVPATLPPEPLQDLGLPPSTDYDSLETMIDQLNVFARTGGYAVCTRSTNKGPPGTSWTGKVVRGTIVCGKSGKHKENHKYLKETGRMRASQTYSRKTDCPFSLKLSVDRETKRFKYTVECGMHNHGYTDPGLFPVHRKLDVNTLETIRTSYKEGAKTSTLLHDLLQRNPDALITHRDLENIRAALAREDKSKRQVAGGSKGHTVLRELLQGMEEIKLPYRYWIRGKAELAGLVVADPTSIALARRYGHVLMFDLVQLPPQNSSRPSIRDLLLVRSSSPSGHEFIVASCYLGHPHELATYITAITLLLDLIPDLATGVVVTEDPGHDAASSPIYLLRQACEQVRPTWRRLIDSSKTLDEFGMLPDEQAVALRRDWETIIASPTVQEYEANVRKLKAGWRLHGPGRMTHQVLDDCLAKLGRDQHDLVTCFTDEVMHFGLANSTGRGDVAAALGTEVAFGLSQHEQSHSGRGPDHDADDLPLPGTDMDGENGQPGSIGSDRQLEDESDASELLPTLSLVQGYNARAIQAVMDAMAMDARYVTEVIARPIFDLLRSRVSSLGLDKIVREYRLAEAASLQHLVTPELAQCFDGLSRCYGLPCSHVLMPLLSAGTALGGSGPYIPLEWIHPHWRLDSVDAVQAEAQDTMLHWKEPPAFNMDTRDHGPLSDLGSADDALPEAGSSIAAMTRRARNRTKATAKRGRSKGKSRVGILGSGPDVAGWTKESEVKASARTLERHTRRGTFEIDLLIDPSVLISNGEADAPVRTVTSGEELVEGGVLYVIDGRDTPRPGRGSPHGNGGRDG